MWIWIFHAEKFTQRQWLLAVLLTAIFQSWNNGISFVPSSPPATSFFLEFWSSLKISQKKSCFLQNYERILYPKPRHCMAADPRTHHGDKRMNDEATPCMQCKIKGYWRWEGLFSVKNVSKDTLIYDDFIVVHCYFHFRPHRSFFQKLHRRQRIDHTGRGSG